MSSSSKDSQDAERRLIELSDLLEISKTLNQSLELDAIINHLLLASMGRFAVGRGIFLLPEGGSRFRVELAKGLSGTAVGTAAEIPNVPELPTVLEDGGEGFEFFTERQLALVIPLRRGGNCVGLLGLGRKLTKTPFKTSEVDFLDSLSGVAAPAIENSRVYAELRDLNVRLDKKVQELNTLFEIGRSLLSTLEAEHVLKALTYALMGQLRLTRHLVVLRPPSGTEVVRMRGIKSEEPHVWSDEGFWAEIDAADGALHSCVERGHPIGALGVEAVIPFRKESVTRGFLGLGTRPSGEPFTEDDLAFATALANQAIISLENAWLFEETIEKRRMEEELALASQIQRNLFPKHLPEIEGYELAARSTPTKHVGGDYYDAIDLGGGRTLIAIADVSGKGTPASLLMSNLQASLRALTSSGIDLAAIAAKMNGLIYSNTDFNKYITFFYGVVDTVTHRFAYTNAGHNPPYLLRADGRLEQLEVGGLPIGLMPGSTYEQAEVEIGPSDLLVLYTDGVNEAVNVANEEFGEERLLELMRGSTGLTVVETLDRISEEIDRFAAGLPQGDDITLLILKRGGAADEGAASGDRS